MCHSEQSEEIWENNHTNKPQIIIYQSIWMFYKERCYSNNFQPPNPLHFLTWGGGGSKSHYFPRLVVSLKGHLYVLKPPPRLSSTQYNLNFSWVWYEYHFSHPLNPTHHQATQLQILRDNKAVQANPTFHNYLNLS